VRAPVSGRVGRLEVTVGNLVPPAAGGAGPHHARLGDPIYASFDADEQAVAARCASFPARRHGARQAGKHPVLMNTPSAARSHRGRLQLVTTSVNAKSGTCACAPSSTTSTCALIRRGRSRRSGRREEPGRACVATTNASSITAAWSPKRRRVATDASGIAKILAEYAAIRDSA